MTDGDSQPAGARIVSLNDDRILLKRALNGDRRANRALVDRLMRVVRARVRRLAARQSRRSTDADDLVQEVWLSLFADRAQKLMAYDPKRGASLETFVGMIAEREALQVLRYQKAQKRGGHLEPEKPFDSGKHLPAEAEAGSPEALTSASDLAERLGVYLAEQLPARGRLVYSFVFTDGLEPSDAAAAMGVNVQVIYNWQHRIRALAREFLTKAEATQPSR